MIKNLVFSGGGVKGISYLGIIKYIEEQKLLKNIENIAASSVGGIFALLITLGYSYEEQARLLFGINLNQLLNIYELNIKTFINNFGINSGENLNKLIKLLIKKKIGCEDITFKELYEKSKINLIITGTCLNKQCIEYFNYINNPDMFVSLALRITYSVPFIFDKVIYNNNVYVDGGLLKNFPMDYFKDDIKHTLGFSLRGKTELIELDNLDNYIISLLYVPSQSLHNKILEKYIKNIIIINTSIDTFKMDLNETEFNNLISIGYKTIEKFLSNNIYND